MKMGLTLSLILGSSQFSTSVHTEAGSSLVWQPLTAATETAASTSTCPQAVFGAKDVATFQRMILQMKEMRMRRDPSRH